MTISTSWINAAGGNWNLAANWSDGVLSGDAALIKLPGTYTVTAPAATTVASLSMQKKATLEITPAGDNAFSDTSQAANDQLAGTIVIDVGTEVRFGNPTVGVTTTFNNTGAIDVQSNTELEFASLDFASAVTLEGRGKLNLLGDRSKISATQAATLTNDSTIDGAGQITGANLTLANGARGIVDADNPNVALTLTPDNDWTNAGIMEATGGGILDFEGDDSLDQTARGELKATTGSTIMADASIVGGIVSIAKGAMLEASGGSRIKPTTIENSGTINVGDNSEIASTLRNSSSGLLLLGTDGGFFGGVSGGSVEIAGNGGAWLWGTTNVIFEPGSTGELIIGGPNPFRGTVSGMAANPGASIILNNIGFADNPTLIYAKGVLTVTDTAASRPIVDKIKILNGGTFTDQSSGSLGDVQIFDPPASDASAPNHGAQLLAQAVASFNPGGGVAASATRSVADGQSSAQFLASPQHGG